MKKGLTIEKIFKKYASSKALSDVSFTIKNGEFFSILGPSGCGKTTLLRILAGFELPDEGNIFLDGKDITHLPPNKRPVNTVFQNYSLFPHLSIWENIAFGLRISKKPEKLIFDEVSRMLHLIQMHDHSHKKPDQISGGQKQRVAIARALVNHPQVLLLDEPLAALDLKLRQKMLLDLDRIHDEVGITFIFVTHDQTEAMAVSDRIAVLDRGCLGQIGTPVEIYETPKSSFVADFIGNTNFFDGTMAEKVQNDYSLLKIDTFPDIMCYNDKRISVGDLVRLSVRPEKIHISKERPVSLPSLFNCFEGVVEEVIYKGDHTHFEILIGLHKIAVIQQHNRFLLDQTPIRWTEPVWIWWHPDDGFMLERKKGE
jgi:spermidine/putrescine transport system ATP-binding protein